METGGVAAGKGLIPVVTRSALPRAGTLSPGYAQALDTIPRWRDYPIKRDADAARWKQRLGEVAAHLAAGHEWPKRDKTQDKEERTLGVWLHTQRIDYRASKLTPAKEAQLNKVIPGWSRTPRLTAHYRTGGGVRPVLASWSEQLALVSPLARVPP